MTEFENKAIGAIRYLGLKAIKKAKGGHVGMTISAAPITYTLYTRIMNINPYDGKWINRDRFILSGGHGSMSLYPIFYLANLMKLEELMAFKQGNSKVAGHPEYENYKSNFIDASTGPLGQGFAMGVGMALAQHIAHRNTEKLFPELFTNYTYVVCGDGDLQEGITYEAAAIAGKYQLNQLIVLHDSNDFQLDSAVSDVSIENLKLRFESNGWDYQICSNNPHDIEVAIRKAQQSPRPSFIEVKTIIAEGLRVQKSNKGHHSTVDHNDIENFKRHFGLDYKDWNIDQEILDHFKETVALRGFNKFKEWEEKVQKYKEKHPEIFAQLDKIINNEFDYKAFFRLAKFDSNQNQATRTYLKTFLSQLENKNNFALAACADLSSSTNLLIGDKNIFQGGQNLPLGIREFALSAIMNGFSLYGMFKVIGGTFLVFADYMKSAIRLGAMMKTPNIYVFTHDSYLIGGDGPTHQPYDQLTMLRAIDNVFVHRPADEEELRQAMIEAYNSKTKTHVLVLTRQNTQSLNVKNLDADQIRVKGAYVVYGKQEADYVLAASGSEVQLAIEVAKKLKNAKVVSVPCLDKTSSLSSKEKSKLFSAKKALITLEASSDYKWYSLHLSNQRNLHLGAFTFGKSTDGEKLYKERGFDPNFIYNAIKENVK